MKLLSSRPFLAFLMAVLAARSGPALRGDELPGHPATLVQGSGEPANGVLKVESSGELTFHQTGSARPIALEPGMVVRLPGEWPPASAGVPPFRLDLGHGQQLSGRLGSVDESHVVLLDAPGRGVIRVARPSVQSLVQRPGETLVLQEGFESLDTSRWTILGEPSVVATPRISGEKSLRLPAGGASLTYRLPDPFAAGRLETSFAQGVAVVAGQKWFVDLTFRSPSGPETVRVALGWSEESLAVESLGGPALAVQRLSRQPGWHRLRVRFGPDQCEVAIDGNELAHGKGLDGPLVEVRLASVSTGGGEAPHDLAGQLDDLRLVRFAEPVGEPEVDVTQDEIRLISGDQIFGQIRGSTPERIDVRVDGRASTFSWSEVSGLYFRREARPGLPVSGLLVRVSWRSGPGHEPRDVDCIEGALTGSTATALNIATPYAGTLPIPVAHLTELAVQGRGERLVIDSNAHHLGDEISTMPPLLDPPRPEGGTLERSFELAHVPTGPAWLVLDVVQVVGEESDSSFAPQVKKGELRTNVALNGAPFDYLNRYISSRNETPERIRLPISKGTLRPGRNVVRFEQVGMAGDPNSLDDLGILGIAIESPPVPRAGGR